MTVEEAEALAKQGNVNAMMALGDYFSKKENDDYDIDRVLYYYELAANAGELQAILEMARTFRYRADVMFHEGIHKYFQRCSVKNKCGTTGAGTYTLDGNYVGCNRCSRGRLPYRIK